MKTNFNLARRLVPVVLAGLLLAACATPGKGITGDDVEHKAHHPEASTSAGPSAAKPSGPGKNGQMGMMGSMDMESMCDMHKNMMSSKSAAEREAMMEQHMKSMSPEMRRQRMEMMEAKCR